MAHTHFSGPIVVGESAYEEITASKTLDAKLSNGMTYGLNSFSGFTVTLPPIAMAGAGYIVTFLLVQALGSNIIITEDATVDTNVIVGGVSCAEMTAVSNSAYSSGATQVNFIATAESRGDFIVLRCDGSNYYLEGFNNFQAGITLT